MVTVVMQWKLHVRFGGRAGETHRWKDRQGAPAGPYTYVATWAGMAYVCFIVDVFSRRIVGWRAASNMRTDMVLDALEMARRQRGTHLEGLVCHSGQYLSGDYRHLVAEVR